MAMPMTRSIPPGGAFQGGYSVYHMPEGGPVTKVWGPGALDAAQKAAKTQFEADKPSSPPPEPGAVVEQGGERRYSESGYPDGLAGRLIDFSKTPLGKIANESDPAKLIGTAGYKGPPADGTVEVGYGIVADHQRRGYATEATRALIERASGRPEVHTVIAETLPELTPSIRVLEKLGFVPAGDGSQPEVIRFERPARASER